ncbi:MAG: glycosyltransferase [Candidatus Planktophila sp.]
MSMQRVTAILVVHDGAAWLPEVVASIASQTRSVEELLAIDTGSIDSSTTLLKGARIPVATLDRDTGFGAAVAYGVNQLPSSIEGAEEWLWILHDDCALHPEALQHLLASTINRPNVVMAGPKLLGWHNRKHLLEVGISLTSNGARWTGLEQDEYDQGQRDGIHEVLAVSTAGALIRRDIFEELGGFDQNLELFRDDIDFGWRVRVAGHSVIIVTDAIGYHSEAAASERRDVDVKGALLHRPHLLDRRNSAYVLLANSGLISLPWLTLQIFASALFRSAGYLIAKLPGYASDEILAIASLIIHPTDLIAARKFRKKSKFISSRVVKPYIPSLLVQFRSSLSKGFQVIREKFIPARATTELPVISDLEANDEEDLLVPTSTRSWTVLFRRPMVLATIFIAAITIAWARHRYGPIAGGALAESPQNASDLFKLYISSWHEIGMGSGLSTPPWVALLASASILTFGNVAFFITALFLLAPFIFLYSAHRYLKKYTDNEWLSAGASLLYALSPVAITAINTGRLGIIVMLALLPIFFGQLRNWVEIDAQSWRRIFAYSLSIWLVYAFNPSVLLIVFIAVIFALVIDFKGAGRDFKNPIFASRVWRRFTILLIPFLLSAPGSFASIIHPSRLLTEIGFSISGGGPSLAILGNPGGPGSPPWWCLSPIVLILLVTFFSSTAARKFSYQGIIFLISATLISSLLIPANGSAMSVPVFSGTFLAIATLFSVTAAVVMFNKIRSRLQNSHLNYRHVSVAAVLLLSVTYSASSAFWLTTVGADSPLKNSASKILPAFLAIEEDAKTVILRPLRHSGEVSLSYYISRGSEITLGQPDVAPPAVPVISRAIEGLVDNTGITSSKILSDHGIKYVFLKNPVSREVVQTIDGLGGFNRTAATKEGIVWKVSQDTGRLNFVDYSGQESVLPSRGVRTYVPAPGTLTLTENYSRSWQIFQDGYRLSKIQGPSGLPTFEVASGGEVLIIHDGTLRRAWISFFLIVFVATIVFALPSGRRKYDIAQSELA